MTACINDPSTPLTMKTAPKIELSDDVKSKDEVIKLTKAPNAT